MVDTSKVRMNLTAITKVDPYAKDIIDSSSHVAFYTFNAERNEWEKTDVEGAFFIYNRSAQPYYSIFINNRLNTNSFVEPITTQLELQAQPPFLLYRNERARIRGFWFYNSQECDRIGNLVKILSNKVDPLLIIPEPMREQVTTKDPNNVNIFKLLSKAQQDYNSQNTSTPSGAPSNVIKFFESARKPLEKSIYRALPATLSVEELEKQHITKANENSQGSQTGFLSCYSDLSLTKVVNDTFQSKKLFDTNLGSLTIPKLQGMNAESDTQWKKFINEPILECLSSPSESIKPALMPPTMFDKPSKNTNEVEKIRREPLSRAELAQAFTYLVENDDGFVEKLHEAYLKSFMKNLLQTYQ